MYVYVYICIYVYIYIYKCIHIHICMNQEKVEPENFRLVDLCLNHLAMLYLDVSQATQILNIYGFVGLTP